MLSTQNLYLAIVKQDSNETRHLFVARGRRIVRLHLKQKYGFSGKIENIGSFHGATLPMISQGLNLSPEFI